MTARRPSRRNLRTKVEAICGVCGVAIWTLFPNRPRCRDCAAVELDAQIAALRGTDR